MRAPGGMARGERVCLQSRREGESQPNGRSAARVSQMTEVPVEERPQKRLGSRRSTSSSRDDEDDDETDNAC